MPKHHQLLSTPQTCVAGFLEAALPPVLTVQSGDRVTIETLSGARHLMPPDGFHVPPELHAVLAANPGVPFGPHILTGPVAVEGAEPGDVLEVRILEVKLRQDWGYNYNRPLAGTLTEDFDVPHHINIPLDSERMLAHMPWGLELPLSPFFGIMSVAPPPSWGRCTSIIPRAFGGNLDNKELVAGTTLLLPVFVPGALFLCGDGHAAQGDGEVNVNAIETALTGTFEFHVQKGMGLTYPRALTPTHIITMGMDPDLDRCVEKALRDMIAWIVTETGLSRADAYALCSIAADLRVTQTVNQHKGVHCMFDRRYLQKA